MIEQKRDRMIDRDIRIGAKLCRTEVVSLIQRNVVGMNGKKSGHDRKTDRQIDENEKCVMNNWAETEVGFLDINVKVVLAEAHLTLPVFLIGSL